MSSEKDHAWYLTRRSRALNDKSLRTKSCDYVLCWLQQTLRGESNPVIDAAVALGHLTGKPVLVYHGLGQHYPHASDRLHQFILEASRSLEQSVQRRGIRFIRYVETTDNQHPGLVYKLASRACAVVLDDQAAFVGRWHAQQVASKLDRLVIAVDGTRLVPEAALGTTLTSTVQFRQRHTQLRDQWLQEPHDLATTAPPYSGDLAIETTDLGNPENCQISKLIARCSIDHGVPAVKGFSGDRTKAITHLYWSLSAQLPGYSRRRNNPAERATSYLSPYLHFGVLWPGDIAQLVLDSDADSRDQWRFLDELLTWREFFHHNACQEKDPTAYTNVPLRARQTLDKHAKDQRQTLHSLDELVHGKTDDELWNVAQRQFLLDGWMHNNLRMYWGEKIISWTPTPEIAWQSACYLNDRFSLDGRDPATYGNLKWCFGSGRAASETQVYGTVPRKSDRALRARPGVKLWVERELNRDSIQVHVPPSIAERRWPQASGKLLT